MLFLATSLVLAPAGARIDSAFAKGEKSENDGGRGGDKDPRGNSAQNRKDGGAPGRSGEKRGSGGSGVDGTATATPWWLQDTGGVPGAAPGAIATAPVTPEATTDDLGASRSLGRPTLSSQIGAVNAAHANSQELRENSGESRVGRIAAYKFGLELLLGAQAELEDARAALAAMQEPARSLTAIRRDLRLAEEEELRLEGEVTRMEQALGAAGGSDAAMEAELQSQREALVLARSTRQQFTGERREALAYRRARQKVEDLEAEVAMYTDDAIELLRAASNKPLSNAVIAEVNRLLGLEHVVLMLPEQALPGEAVK